MVVERYDQADLSELVPTLGLETDQELCELERLLSDDAIFSHVNLDMGKRRCNSARLGRHWGYQ